MASRFGGLYEGKKVLVTGHTGFKGSWLCLWLQKLGSEVLGFSKDIPTEPSHYQLLNLDLTSITGDVRDRPTLVETMQRHRPDIVFHLAAQSIVRKSYRQPAETFETNVMGTVNVLESCRQTDSVRAVIIVTSDKCYRNDGGGRPHQEADPMGGQDPYSASKGSAELASSAYRASFFSPSRFGKKHSALVADVRAGNVVGGGDWAEDRLIPDIARATSQGEEVIIRNPQSIRPWQHVLEPLRGYLLIGEKLLRGDTAFSDNWNFGPSNATFLNVEQVLNIAKKYWPKTSFRVQKNDSDFPEEKVLLLDSTKARTKLHWQSLWEGEETFRKTIEWYRAYYENKKILSADQLEEYTTAL